jgi:hypothetical protein
MFDERVGNAVRVFYAARVYFKMACPAIDETGVRWMAQEYNTC